MLVAEPSASAATAGPDFVEDEGQAAIVAEAAHLVGVIGRIEIDAALALDGFHENAGGLVVDRFLEALHAAAVNLDKSGDGGLEADLDGGISGGGDHGERSAVETFVEGDDLPSLGGKFLALEAREFAGGFVGFQAAVAEKCLAAEGRDDSVARQIRPVARCERCCRRARGDWPARSRRRSSCGWQWPRIAPPKPAKRSMKMFAVGVPEFGALSAHHGDGLAGIVADEDFGGAIDYFLRRRHVVPSLSSINITK